jgi:hypothetical protein
MHRPIIAGTGQTAHSAPSFRPAVGIQHPAPHLCAARQAAVPFPGWSVLDPRFRERDGRECRGGSGRLDKFVGGLRTSVIPVLVTGIHSRGVDGQAQTEGTKRQAHCIRLCGLRKSHLIPSLLLSANPRNRPEWIPVTSTGMTEERAARCPSFVGIHAGPPATPNEPGQAKGNCARQSPRGWLDKFLGNPPLRRLDRPN